MIRLESGGVARARVNRAAHEPAIGDPVSVMIRPERLRVAVEPGATSDGRTLEGQMRSMIFQGSQIRLDIELADGTSVVSWVEPDGHLPAIRPGSPVSVTWNPGAAFLLAGWPSQSGANDTDVDQIEAAL